jgi:hypothetical protein
LLLNGDQKSCLRDKEQARLDPMKLAAGGQISSAGQ